MIFDCPHDGDCTKCSSLCDPPRYDFSKGKTIPEMLDEVEFIADQLRYKNG